ncbi:uncharacterized protein HKW66_Vig0141150 [Vigna angularis]|uniref:Uncharacterized protein n=1 Tax=Phaseolus angularis TaxID=3914 RepID=A0A8T0KEM2_PHAAN|nr:uncharacterized protein HKW66_Vig0141150 [Vigna angularis]
MTKFRKKKQKEEQTFCVITQERLSYHMIYCVRIRRFYPTRPSQGEVVSEFGWAWNQRGDKRREGADESFDSSDFDQPPGRRQPSRWDLSAVRSGHDDNVVEIPFISDENVNEDPELRIIIDDEGPVGKRMKDTMFSNEKPLILEKIRVWHLRFVRGKTYVDNVIETAAVAASVCNKKGTDTNAFFVFCF